MEKISKKRGRPSAFQPTELAAVKAVGLAMGSDRSTANAMYRQRALRVLIESDKPKRFKWLYDRELSKFRGTILCELGRIDPALIEDVAIRLSEIKPKASDAVAMLRRWRLEREGRAQWPRRELWKCILDAVDEFQIRWPDTTNEEALEALQAAHDEWKSAMEEAKN